MKRKQKKQPYLIGGLLVVMTLTAALLLVYTSSKDAIPVDVPLSSAPVSEMTSLEETSQPEEEVVSEESSSPPRKAGDMSFTEDELAELEAMIQAAENVVYPVSSEEDSSSSLSSQGPSQVSSEKEEPVKRTISVYFKDIESGYSYTYQDDHKFFVASLIKAPYCLYLYTLAEEGKCDLEETFTVNFKDIKQGTGKIKEKKEEEFPLTMTTRELISFAIQYSDNTAMEILRKKYDHTGYLAYAKSIGIQYPVDVKHIVDGSITATDAGVYLEAIYDYIETGVYGKELKEDMSKTGNAMIRSKYPVVRKYGWAELSFHDMAVVYAPRPYLLAICTDRDRGTQTDYKLFADIAKKLEEFQGKRE